MTTDSVGPSGGPRRRRRRRLLVLPFVIVLLAVTIKLLTMSWYSTRGVSAYTDADYQRSAAQFDRLKILNIIEPWRAHQGSGSRCIARTTSREPNQRSGQPSSTHPSAVTCGSIWSSRSKRKATC